MARIDNDELLKVAERFAANQQRQAQQKSIELEAEMLNRRRNFLQPEDRVFFESIIEGSDLLPMRYFSIGQLAAKAVGRLHVPVPNGQSEGYATGFLVAPNVLLTNQHVLRTKQWAASATLVMDSEDAVDGLPMVPRVFQLEQRDFMFPINI